MKFSNIWDCEGTTWLVPFHLICASLQGFGTLMFETTV
nr:hypothetical protein Iba_chr10aCG15250 [Ipomoea batatas]